MLRQAADGADLLQRERLQTTRRELERLTTLRLEVAGCLEASIAALHKATDLLAADAATKTDDSTRTANVSAPAAEDAVSDPGIQPGMPRHHVLPFLAPAVGCLALVALLAYQFGIPGTPAPAPPEGRDGTGARVEDPIVPDVPVTAPPETASNGTGQNGSDSLTPDRGQVAGLVLTLIARRACWIGTVLDGSQNLERLLKADETIILYAHDEAVLRLGDAGAVSVLINNQPTKALGADGQVTTKRITRANYATFLADANPQTLLHGAVPGSDGARLASTF